MATQSSPTLQRRRLARRLRAMRDTAGMTLNEAAPKLDKTRSALGRIEKGETTADVHVVRTMMDVYDIYDPDLIDLAREAMRPGWWVAYGIRDRGFIGLETDASESLELSLMYVPGLLQTEDYMRAVFGTGQVKRTKKRLENQIAARLIRQRRLVNEEAPLTFSAILDETVLRKPIGGRDVMRAQLRSLLRAAELDTVTIQVIPDDVGEHEGMDGAFTVLEFQQPDDPNLLYVEYPTGAIHVEKIEEVTDARLLFSNLRLVALPPAESLAFIESIAAERYSP
jgi:transcriptional regulator with XRE-family HTH domain